MITQKFLRRRESGLLDQGAPQILSAAKDDSLSRVILSTAKDLCPSRVILSAAKDLLSTYG